MTGNSTHENVLLHDAHMCQAKIHLSGVHGSYPDQWNSHVIQSCQLSDNKYEANFCQTFSDKQSSILSRTTKKEIRIRCVFVSHKKVCLPLVFVLHVTDLEPFTFQLMTTCHWKGSRFFLVKTTVSRYLVKTYKNL